MADETVHLGLDYRPPTLGVIQHSKWIAVSWAGRSASGKTSVWTVTSTDGGETLGVIAWFGRWRRYAFYPAGGTVFEQDCLRDIASFCEDETRAHRQTRNDPPNRQAD